MFLMGSISILKLIKKYYEKNFGKVNEDNNGDEFNRKKYFVF